ncbi:glycoside hydrolase family 10 protein [Chondrinema litorale]|uniref:glycoside hydrolase family 10 protein n=1 Tax=Chondrinema litorale TaxID=2994555 RepID=UPI0025430D32|nr:family 10 glycosylhydrolase [Chondrinema litorale]UZR95881.1 family 10 glycosylhydrolase [Chondrinema litorale]
MLKRIKNILILSSTFLVVFLTVQLVTVYINGLSAQVPPKREFRAIWITTLNNSDWPSKKGLPVEEQKKEFITILDQCAKSNINAVIVQIRPSGDAFYKSNFEPWSEWLMGKQGMSPPSGYDPLEFMIQEAHKRQIELHAWMNPLRAVYNRYSDVHEKHVSKVNPQWFFKYGGTTFFNPGIPEVRDYICKVVFDVASRYDIDGIHFDDYFYPYPNSDEKLKDDNTFWKYRNGIRDKSEWRRENVNNLIETIHEGLSAIRPELKFGISPSAVWRNIYDSPLGSYTRAGVASYDHLHADIRLWLEKGWIDYVIPQIYFSTEHKHANYRTLVRWWNRNTFNRHLYIGQAAYKIYWDRDKTWYSKQEMPKQLSYNRSLNQVKGSVFFRANSFMRNRGNFRDSLETNWYKYPSITPPMPWKDDVPPRKPDNFKVTLQNNGMQLSWEKPAPAQDNDNAIRYILYKLPIDSHPDVIENPQNILAILDGEHFTFTDTAANSYETHEYLITSLDKLNNESAPAKPQIEPLLVLDKFSFKEFRYYYRFFENGISNHFGWLKQVENTVAEGIETGR